MMVLTLLSQNFIFPAHISFQFVKRPKRTWRRLTCLTGSMYQRRRRLLGTLSGGRMLVETTFTNALYPDDTGGHHFCTLSLSCPQRRGSAPSPPPALFAGRAGRHGQRAALPTPSHATRRAPPEPTIACSPHRGHPLSAKLRQMAGRLCFWTPREWNKQRVRGTTEN